MAIPIDARFAALALFVFLGSGTQALSGFGGIIIALTLGANLYPIEALLPVLVPLSLVVTSYIVVRHGGAIDRPLLLRTILPFMGAGFVAGVALFHSFGASPVLERAYGVLVIAIAARELYYLLRFKRPGLREAPTRGAPASAGAAALTSPSPAAPPEAPPAASPAASPSASTGADAASAHALGGGATRRPRIPVAWIVAAGVVQGTYASGGPPLVYALDKAGVGKASFRSTLCIVWLTLNSTLTASYVATGKLTAATLPAIGWLLPVLAAAILAGEWGHRRVDERRFRIVVFALLVLAGASVAVAP